MISRSNFSREDYKPIVLGRTLLLAGSSPLELPVKLHLLSLVCHHKAEFLKSPTNLVLLRIMSAHISL